jgi:hypothetical protein
MSLMLRRKVLRMPSLVCCCSTLHRFSLANIPAGSRLLWVHLASVYVVTTVTLAVRVCVISSTNTCTWLAGGLQAHLCGGVRIQYQEAQLKIARISCLSPLQKHDFLPQHAPGPAPGCSSTPDALLPVALACLPLQLLWHSTSSALHLYLTHPASPAASTAGATHTALLRDIPGVLRGTMLDKVSTAISRGRVGG